MGYDSSLNGNVSIGNDLIIGGRLSVRQYSSQNIINTTTTNYQLIVSEDLSLNGRLFTSGNVVVGGNVVMAPSFTTTTNVTPNSINIISASWAKDGITWEAKASTAQVSWPVYYPFDTVTAPTTTNRWAITSNAYNTSNGNYTAAAFPTTIQNSVGTIQGEWLQISSSKNVILNSYSFVAFTSGGAGARVLPGTFYICGSLDETTWYPIIYVQQTGTITGTESSVTTINHTVPSNVVVGSTTAISGATTTTYSTSKDNYRFFRLVVTKLLSPNYSPSGSSDGFLAIGEWTPTFTLQTDTLTLSSNKSTTNKMVLSVDGQVGIGSTNPAVALDVSGVIFSTKPMIGYYHNTTQQSLTAQDLRVVFNTIDPSFNNFSNFIGLEKINDNEFKNTSGTTKIYYVSAHAAIAKNTSDYRYMWIGVNMAQQRIGFTVTGTGTPTTGDANNFSSASGIVLLKPNDWFSIYFYQNSGSSLNLGATAGFTYPSYLMTRIIITLL